MSPPYFLAEHSRVAIYVKVIVLQLESHAYHFAELVKAFGILARASPIIAPILPLLL